MPLLKTLSDAILDTIVELAEMWPDPLEGKYAYQKRLNRRLLGYQEKSISPTIWRLKKNGLIRKNKNRYQITNKGKEKYLIQHIINSQDDKSQAQLIIVFDIPEGKLSIRNNLRRILRKISFETVQKSVMVGSVNLDNSFFELLEFYNIQNHVKIYEVFEQKIKKNVHKT